MQIKGFIENTLIDWEGRVAAVLFVPGCNFRCAYCHASHLLNPDASDESIPIEHVLSSLLRNRGWIDGVVISGGEPTLHKGLRKLVDLFHDSDIPVKLDTNGSRPGVLAELLENNLLGYVAMDVKAPLDYRYGEVASAPVNTEDIRESIEMLIASDIDYEFRTTVCPTQLDAPEIEGIGQAVRGAKAYILQTFRPVNCLDPSLEEVKPYTGDKMRELAKVASKYVQRCMVRGDTASETVQRKG